MARCTRCSLDGSRPPAISSPSCDSLTTSPSLISSYGSAFGVMYTTSSVRALTFPAVPTTRPRRCISRAVATTSARSDTPYGLLVRGLQYSQLGEKRRHQLGGGDVECGVEGGEAAAAMSGFPVDRAEHLRRVALLDRYLATVDGPGVDRRDRRCHVERAPGPRA